MFPGQAEKGPPHLVRERRLKLADIQGADQRDAVCGSPVVVPGVFGRLPGEAAAQPHHGRRWASSCPEADTGSLPSGHPVDVHASWLWTERVHPEKAGPWEGIGFGQPDQTPTGFSSLPRLPLGLTAVQRWRLPPAPAQTRDSDRLPLADLLEDILGAAIPIDRKQSQIAWRVERPDIAASSTGYPAKAELQIKRALLSLFF